MNLSIEKSDQFSVILVEDEKLNSMNAPELKSELVVLNSQGVANIIVDLSAVKFVDSSGLSAILIGNRLCSSSNGSFVITKLQENVLKLIKISQLDNILSITPTMEEAKDLIVLESVERSINEEGED
jgi:anti-anti-sigma factor